MWRANEHQPGTISSRSNDFTTSLSCEALGDFHQLPTAFLRSDGIMHRVTGREKVGAAQRGRARNEGTEESRV
jgi:hypothetical protein